MQIWSRCHWLSMNLSCEMHSWSFRNRSHLYRRSSNCWSYVHLSAKIPLWNQFHWVLLGFSEETSSLWKLWLQLYDNMPNALASVAVETIRKWEHQMKRCQWMEAYEDGLDAKDAQIQVKSHSSVLNATHLTEGFPSMLQQLWPHKFHF